jgi:serine/threonine protein kinase
MIGRKYRLIEMIGEGAFGAVLKGEHVYNREKVAIKIEKKTSSVNMLKNESKIYLMLNKEDSVCGFPNLKWFGKDEQFYYMVLELLGESLTAFKSTSSADLSIPLPIVAKIGVQIIQRIKSVHQKGLIHRDIKPDNFLFGLGRNNQTVYLIDFGFCKNYVTSEGEHILEGEKTSGVIGTPNFVSVNAHNLRALSRKDDIESAIYVLIYLFLPLKQWRKIFKDDSTNDQIKMVKMGLRSTNHSPLSGTPFAEALMICDALKYVEEPNYARLSHIISLF